MKIDNDDRRRWYVLQTKPKQEARADSNLRRWGIETFAPKVRELDRSRAGETSYRVGPLFPNYLFARFDAAVLLAKIRLTRGIQRVVGLGEFATPIDDDIISLIQSRIGDDGFVRPSELHAGDTVEIVKGPLRSLVGIFERHTSARERVVILLTTLGCQARVVVAKAAIQKAARSA
uniref:Transcriptional activator RfaH n=1 Tax=uncultured bacterium AZ_379 TaxID=1630015 RepID=A0A0E3M283_9BACT|nr:transcriptional activator RfaH [uncultured bacterium AZ_379]